MSDGLSSPIVHWAGPREMSLLLEPFDPDRQPTISPTPVDPYTIEFFENMVVKITETFPVEAFALQQGCSKEQVADALYAVFLANCPLNEAHVDGAINEIEDWRKSAACDDSESVPETSAGTGNSDDSGMAATTSAGTDEGQPPMGSDHTAQDPIIIE
ncbi:hypothetical protein N7540_011638 [Penicillium herquei]|nr:hypothetical protein N7540_011638 [Penicillium herquei]